MTNSSHTNMQILFRNNNTRNSKKALVLLIREDKKLPSIIKLLDRDDIIENTMKLDTSFKANLSQILYISPHKNLSEKGTFIVGVGKNPNVSDIQQVGEAIAVKLNQHKIDEVYIYSDLPTVVKSLLSDSEIACNLAFGIGRRNYKFVKYYTQKIEERKLFLSKIHICSKQFKTAEEYFNMTYDSLLDGIHFTRDLVNEPANILTPRAFADKCAEFHKYGLKIRILDLKEMKKLQMNALIGVAQGSVNEPYLVCMEWYGNSIKEREDVIVSNEDQSFVNFNEDFDDSKLHSNLEKEQRVQIVFAGKGVTFDSGGINIKPSNGISEMKYDMSGAATVAGLMITLAKRKAKVDAVGIIGIVENMPSGSAQRPSDVVKSMSGQTIEVDNTDAEGRLVLADVMWYAQEVYRPEVMIDLATLTGAIVVSLGNEYAGLFSNNEILAKRLCEVGKATSELLWRFPMSKNYDKQIDSDIADVKNTGMGYGAGSTTAAQFLQRFIKKNCHWAHLDIAGVAFAKSDTTSCPKGATGFGVRLLNEFVSQFYEKNDK